MPDLAIGCAGLLQDQTQITTRGGDFQRMRGGPASIGVQCNADVRLSDFEDSSDNLDVFRGATSTHFELQTYKTLFLFFHRCAHSFFRTTYIDRVVARHPFAGDATEEITHTSAIVFADNVPQGHVDGRLGVVVSHQTSIHDSPCLIDV